MRGIERSAACDDTVILEPFAESLNEIHFVLEYFFLPNSYRFIWLHRVLPPRKNDARWAAQVHEGDLFRVEMSNVFRPFVLIEEDPRSFAELDFHL